MIIYLMLIVFLVLLNISKCKDEDFLSLKQTTAINGLFILFVFFRHLSQYIMFNSSLDLPMVLIDKSLGQLIVCMFLFNSGYGIMESIKNKYNYISSIPKKRIFKTLIQFDICVVLYFIVNYLFGNNISISKLLLSLICVESIGNSNWYILSIIIMWLITYISFKVNKKSLLKGIYACFLFTILYILILIIIKAPNYYYNTLLCYVYGLLFSYFYSEIKKILLNFKYWIICFSINLILFLIAIFFIYKNSNLIVTYEIMSILFASLIILIQFKINIYNKALYLLGKNLFYLYILQRIPMFIFQKIGLADYNKYLYAFVCFIFMILLGFIFQFITNRISNYNRKKERGVKNV